MADRLQKFYTIKYSLWKIRKCDFHWIKQKESEFGVSIPNALNIKQYREEVDRQLPTMSDEFIDGLYNLFISIDLVRG